MHHLPQCVINVTNPASHSKGSKHRLGQTPTSQTRLYDRCQSARLISSYPCQLHEATSNDNIRANAHKKPPNKKFLTTWKVLYVHCVSIALYLCQTLVLLKGCWVVHSGGYGQVCSASKFKCLRARRKCDTHCHDPQLPIALLHLIIATDDKKQTICILLMLC